MSSSRINRLAEEILKNANVYSEDLSMSNLPEPSFSKDAVPETELSSSAMAARAAVLEASNELQDLIRGPIDIVRSNMVDFSHLAAMQAIYRYKIVYAIPMDGIIAFPDLAAKCNLEASIIKRILRYAIACRLFEEPIDGFVAHNAASKAILLTPNLNDWIGMITDEWWPACTRMVDALETWPGSQEPSETGWSLGHNTRKNPFEDMSSCKFRAERFAKSMNMISTLPEMDPSSLIKAYPWDVFNQGNRTLLVDVGGSYGSVSKILAEAYPNMHCIVQDLPEVIAKVQVPSTLADRFKFMEHDFFQEQKVKYADVYFFRLVFHDWSDKYCIDILRKTIPAFKTGSRLIICDTCMPEPGEIPLGLEKRLRAIDLGMLSNFNSKERGLEDWKLLFEAASPGFDFKGVTKLRGSILALIETEWTL